MGTKRMSHKNLGAPCSWYERPKATKAKSAVAQPRIRKTAKVKMSSRNKSSNVHAVSQSPWTQSAPKRAKSLQPGGRFKCTRTDSASERQPVAGKEVGCDNRPMASTSTVRERSSTPMAPFSGLRVMS